MTSEKLQRTSYRDPNISNNPVRSGSPTLGENAQDMDQYYRPLERIHGSSLHGWGVASGLSVTATLNSATLTIQPGVALDSSGRHISLAVGGNAEVGSKPTGFSTGATFNPVLAGGVAMPTTNMTGDKYLTIQFWETFDSDSYNNSGLFIYMHTPWLQLLDVAGFTNDGSQVVLAKVSFGSGATAGQVTALTQDLRQATDRPVGSISIHLQRIVTTGPASANVETVDTAVAGVIRANAAGGLNITVPNASDEVHLERDDGTNFAKVSLGAEKIVARQGNGTESVVIDTEAGSVTASGGVTASSITASGNITTSGNIAASNGTISASNVTATGTIQGGSIAASRATVSGPVSATSVKASANIDATFIRQNELYMSGGVGWSSLSYNAHHDANKNWVFPDRSRPCVTLEMDSAYGPSRFEVWTTTRSEMANTNNLDQKRFAIDGDTGEVTIPGSLQVNGTKSFVQDHPSDPTRQIVYVSLEGDEAGTYTRGTWKLEGGKAVIELPEHFGMVTSEDGLSIQLTPRGEWLQLYVVRLTTRQVVIQEAQGKSGQFDYFIQGVRKGYEHHEVIQEKK